MRIILLLSIWLLCSRSNASDITNIALEIKGPLVRGHCSDLADLTNAVSQWKNRLDGKAQNPFLNNTTLLADGRCSIELSKSFPERFSGLLGTHTKSGTPNCYNTALNAQGLVNGIRMTILPEIEGWIGSKHCVLNNKNPSPGDTILFYRSGGGFFGGHAIVYLTNKIGFHKWSNQTNSKFELVDYKRLFKKKYPYHVSDECQQIDEAGACDSYTQVISCNPSKEVHYRMYEPVIGAIEKEVETIIKTKKSISRNPYRKLALKLEAFKNSLAGVEFPDKQILLNRHHSTRYELITIKTRFTNNGSIKSYMRAVQRREKTKDWDSAL